ncbi:MAG TPA: hypothetical protein VNL71_05085 [Chloroflexota bacterium]|nr:hypothetical protein [Chloroflexota bacterium]
MSSNAWAKSDPTPLPSVTRVPGILRHLAQLSEPLKSEGDPIVFIHIYARPEGEGPQSPLRFIRAGESGPEGIACVDDAARAALLGLAAYEQLRVPAARSLAWGWLGFVAYMQDPDGRFTNFIVDRAGRKKRHGRTSYAGGQWWTSRALWALAAGWRVTGDSRYRELFEQGKFAGTQDLKVVSVQALALMECYAAEPTAALAQRIQRLCDRVVASGSDYMRDRKGTSGLLPWGYHQLQAVARAGRLFSRLDYLVACERTVTGAIEPLVSGRFTATTPWSQEPKCVYDVSSLMLGLEELYHATGQELYRELALACFDWLHEDNPVGCSLYNPRNGRCADGVSEEEISPNCGAESAIEAGFMELARRRLMKDR